MSDDRRSRFLNWDAVTDPSIADALEALQASDRLAHRWTNLSAEARDLHHRILRAYLDTGAPPDNITAPALAELRARDLVFLGDGMVGAYPFAPEKSGHRVCTAGSAYWAVCAIDAFGIAAMLGAPARIETCCGACDAKIAFEVTGHEVKPDSAEALVWAAVRDIGGCAANSQCRTMRAFCGEAHLRRYTGDETGFALSAQQASQIGAAIFGPGSAFGDVLAAA